MNKRYTRNLAMFYMAATANHDIRFTYTNRQGVTKRRNAKPIALRPTRNGFVFTATDSEGTKSFRIDRVYRITLV